MYCFEEIKSRSKSSKEIVVEYLDAIKLLYIFEQNNTSVLGWEGWIKYPDGSLGHSKNHQGTTDLSCSSNSSAIALIKDSLIQAHTKWEVKPEVNDAELLFCITTN